MPTYRFSIGRLFCWLGEEYTIVRLLSRGGVNIEHAATGTVSTQEMPLLVTELFAGRLAFLDERSRTQAPGAGGPRPSDSTSDDSPDAAGDGAATAGAGAVGVGVGVLDKSTGARVERLLDDYPAHLVHIARYRLAVIKPLLDEHVGVAGAGATAGAGAGGSSGAGRTAGAGDVPHGAQEGKRQRRGKYGLSMHEAVKQRVREVKNQLLAWERRKYAVDQPGGDDVGEERQSALPAATFDLSGPELVEWLAYITTHNITYDTPADNKSLLVSISTTSVYRWLRLYVEAGYDIRSLIPNTRSRGGAGKTRLDPRVEAVIQSSIDDWKRRENYTISNVAYEARERIRESNSLLPAPSAESTETAPDPEHHGNHDGNHRRSDADDARLALPSRRTVARRIEALDEECRIQRNLRMD